MPIYYDKTKDPFYLEGFIEGFVESFAENYPDGYAEGRKAAQSRLLPRIVASGVFIDAKIAELLQVSLEDISQARKHLLT